MNQAKERRDGGKIFHGIRKSIEFKNVSFTYDKNRRTLKKINVKILPKQITAIVGPTGSGKSTFVDMLPRLREPDEGKILFDDDILSSLDIMTLRKKIASRGKKDYFKKFNSNLVCQYIIDKTFNIKNKNKYFWD